MSFVTPKREMVTRVGTLLVTHTILDEKLSKFDESLNDCEHYL